MPDEALRAHLTALRDQHATQREACAARLAQIDQERATLIPLINQHHGAVQVCDAALADPPPPPDSATEE